MPEAGDRMRIEPSLPRGLLGRTAPPSPERVRIGDAIDRSARGLGRAQVHATDLPPLIAELDRAGRLDAQSDQPEASGRKASTGVASH